MEYSTPKVSVIIPIYNVERYLKECLDSVVNQTLSDIEIICVDDGSTDGTPTILEQYRQRDPRITVFTQENRGQSAARNRGMDAARGEYICFVDSDDYVDLTMLEKTTALADKMELDALVFGLESFTDSLDPVSLEEGDDLEFSFKPVQCSADVLSGAEYIKWSKDNRAYPTVAVAELWRSTLLVDNALRFKEGIIYEDELFSFRCLMAAKRVYQITDSFYHYRRWGHSTTFKQPSHKNVESYFACALGVLEYAFRESNTPLESEEIWRAYDQMARLTEYSYHCLPQQEKEKLVFANKMEEGLFRQIVISSCYTEREAALFRPLRDLRRSAINLRDRGLDHLSGRTRNRRNDRGIK